MKMGNLFLLTTWRCRIPTGHIRLDPKTASFSAGPGCPPPSYQELVNEGRQEDESISVFVVQGLFVERVWDVYYWERQRVLS